MGTFRPKEDALDKVYNIVDEWHKAVLENRIHELMKNGGDEGREGLPYD
ncbi:MULTISPECIES: hypothetical protein [Sphingobacterium]|nr:MULTISPECIES: hypothetical protein [Sphingobacterium]MCW8313566.1 hypothetical protein [Sphingobacterium sp. InxBP1]